MAALVQAVIRSRRTGERMTVPRRDIFQADATIRNGDDLLNALDTLLQSGSSNNAWWDSFFADRTRSVPFFVSAPDESLVADFAAYRLQPGRVLELGCGNGRNAIYMASQQCVVDAVDFSEAAIAWSNDNARLANQPVAFIHASVFELDVVPATYDIVYDSGCFHHVAPHRREAYVALVSTALKPGGFLSMICFTPEGGAGLTDLQVYERRTLGGGLGFSAQNISDIFGSGFDLIDLRTMRETSPGETLYGRAFLQSVLLQKQ
jgi:SAM-dependent methyltransferase